MSQNDKFIAEKNLIDTLDRVSRSQASYSALYVNLSKLKPNHRHPSFSRIIAQLFDDLVGAAEGMMFILNSGDFVILGKNITSNTITNAIEKLRKGLAFNPVLFNENISEFANLYVFPNDYYTLYSYIKSLINTTTISDTSNSSYPVEASQMDGVIEHLNNINVAEIIKHQSIIRIENANKFKLLFQEFFVAVKDLSTQYDRSIDLIANKWLFLYLTQNLDKKTIASFSAAEIKNWPQQISLNLHLSTIFSREFDNLLKNGIPAQTKVIAEVQMLEVFNNIEKFFAAKEKLHSQGNQILIDALIPETLSLVDIKRLDPDFIKIFWHPMMEVDIDNNNKELQSIINEFGNERIILAKCTDASALKWGISYNIRNFQGPYIDNLETSIIRSKCTNSSNCSAVDCLKRRRKIAGITRRECKDIESLETLLE